MDRKFRWGMIALAISALAVVASTGYYFGNRAEKEPKYVQQGEASWYGPGFHGGKTASGETYDQNDLTAAHRKLPLGSEATITNLENGKQVEVKINDRGP
ncbi:MAG: septal ring lytic transglycosylase RlpA family protein, partial [Rhodospirillales bacterium]